MLPCKFRQRVTGVICLAVAAGGMALNWYFALAVGRYFPTGAVAFPCLICFALCLLVFPIDVVKFRAKYGVERIETMRQLPPTWVVLLIAGVAAGLGNWYAHWRFIH